MNEGCGIGSGLHCGKWPNDWQQNPSCGVYNVGYTESYNGETSWRNAAISQRIRVLLTSRSPYVTNALPSGVKRCAHWTPFSPPGICTCKIFANGLHDMRLTNIQL